MLKRRITYNEAVTMMSEQLDPRLMLKQALVKERMMSFELSTLDDEFYQVIRRWLDNLPEDDKVSMTGLLYTLFQIRKNKITTLAVSLNTDSREKMTLEEKKYFDAISNATVEFKDGVGI